MVLRGRAEELRALTTFLSALRGGLGGTLVVRGDPGAGKTALLTHAGASLRTLRLSGVPAEAGYPYAALHRLLIPLLASGNALPPRQRRALDTACGEGRPADPHLVGLATTALLSRAGPLLCLVDDAQWIDRPSLEALAFVARRSAQVGLIFATRGPLGELSEFPTLSLTGLSPAHSIELLHDAATTPIDHLVATRLASATAGNPRALLDLTRELSADQLAGARTLPDPPPIGRRLTAHHLRVIRRLPEPTRRWLLLAAAAQPTGDLGCITAAAHRIDLPLDAPAPAEDAGVLTLGATADFHHPLTRSAVYSGATAAQRRTTHALLAEVTTRPDLRAWHRAAAHVGQDETIAAELARAGSDPTLLTRAAELTPDGPARTARLLTAAEAALAAGAPVQALRLTENIPTDAKTLLVRAKALVMTAGPSAFAKGAELCLTAARAAAPCHPRRSAEASCHPRLSEASCHPRRSAEALAEAVEHAIGAGHLLHGTSPAEIAAEITRAGIHDLVLTAFVALSTRAEPALLGSQPPATTDVHIEPPVPRIRAATAALLDPATTDPEVLRQHMPAAAFGALLWDADAQRALWQRAILAARRSGTPWQLLTALYAAATLEVQLGELTAAEALIADANQTRAAIGAPTQHWTIDGHPELLAWRGTDGHQNLTTGLTEALAEAERLGAGSLQSLIRISFVVLALSRGDYAQARTVAREVHDTDTLTLHSRILPDLIEAATRSGDQALAHQAFTTLTTQATAAGTDWSLGVLARSRALLAPSRPPSDEPHCGALLSPSRPPSDQPHSTAPPCPCAPRPDPEACYRRALALLARTPARTDLARTHLLYGEWLRRQRRRRDARTHLRTALEMFESIGAPAFAARALRELSTTGSPPRPRNAAPEAATDTRPHHRGPALTPQEATIARLAATGATNSEIAAQLFISANTVDYHLRKVFRKLHITSRRQLPPTPREQQP